MTTRTPNTFIVGAGPVATSLARGLRLGGVPVLGLWARRPEAARAAGASAGVASYSAAPPDLLLEARALILAVRDDAVAEVAKMLLATGLISPRHVLLHCSGAQSAQEVFASVCGSVAGVATLHPLRAISTTDDGQASLANTVFGIEGDDVGLAVARDLVSAMAGECLELRGEQMAAYHAAAAMASNYVVALLDAAAAVLELTGMSRVTAAASLMPLARGAIDNVAERGVVDGLTGPIRRGDRATVQRHLDAIPAPLRRLYCELGRVTLDVARRGDRASSGPGMGVESGAGTDAKFADFDAIAALFSTVLD